MEAATLVGRRSEECRLDSPPALGGAALGRRTANAGADAWSRRDVGPRCRHRRQTSPTRAHCGAPRAAATTGSPRRRPSSRYPPPPPLPQPPAARRGEEAPKDHLAAARRGGEGEGAGRRSEEGRRGRARRGDATPLDRDWARRRASLQASASGSVTASTTARAGQTARRERSWGGASRGRGAGGARGRVRLPQNDPKRGEKEGKRWGPLQSNPNKHPLEGIVFWGGLDASNPI